MTDNVVFDKEEMIDWQREAKEEIKTKRFCPNCWQLEEIKLLELKYYQNFYSCKNCGEMIFKKGYVRFNSGSGYGYRNHLRFAQRFKSS
ncbi:MAG: hypothetical protein FK731_13950 [Asgard group archaeon]|nr:hypothetical protein [Asgard group archaeon]